MRYSITIEAESEQELTAIVRAILEARGAPAPGQVPMPLGDPPAGNGPLCPEHRAPMIWKPADASKQRPAAYWCQTFGCRQRAAA